MKYLCWFFGKTKYEHDPIVFEWFKYSSYLKKGQPKLNQFWLPHIETALVQLSIQVFACM